MRHPQVWLTLLCLLTGCAAPRCGAGAARVEPVATTSTPAPDSHSASAPAPSPQLMESQEVEMLGKIKARRGGTGVRYTAPSPPELADFARWFQALIAAAQSNGAAPRDAPSGFELDASDSELWIAGEQANERRGAGAYAIRTGLSSPWVVQAPHTFFDVGTLEIAATCFEELNARALFVNSVRRSNSQDEELEQPQRAEVARSGEADSDLAHAPESFFSTAHSAVTRQSPAYGVLQIHGFRDELLPTVLAVVSAAGTRAPVLQVAAELQSLLGRDAVQRYPDEVKKLGGTRNVQARLSQGNGSGFIHLELSRSLRERLRSDSEFRRSFAGALKRALLDAQKR